MPALRRAPGARSLSAVLGGPTEMTKLVAVCVALILLEAVPSRALDLQVQPTMTAYRSREPIVVRVLVVNPLARRASGT